MGWAVRYLFCALSPVGFAEQCSSSFTQHEAVVAVCPPLPKQDWPRTMYILSPEFYSHRFGQVHCPFINTAFYDIPTIADEAS